MVRGFQQAMLALRYSEVPVVAAPAGLALGGGCEVVLHCDRVQAAGETYLGLVEVGVGLIPAGGGTKEMVVRAMDRAAVAAADPLAAVQAAFETVALAKVSASGPDAARLGYLAASDGFTMNRERLIADAKAVALGAGRGRLPSAAAANGDSGRRRVAGRGAEARRAPGVARRTRLRSRRAHRPHAGHALGRRRAAARHHDQRAALPGSRTRGVPEACSASRRRWPASSTRWPDRQAAEELSDGQASSSAAQGLPIVARPRHPGPMGVDGADDGRAGRARPRHHVFALRRADERLRLVHGTRLRELPRAARRRARGDRRRRGRCWSASPTAAWSRRSSRPAIPERVRRAGASPRRRRRLDARSPRAPLSAARRGCSAPLFWLGAPLRAYPELKAAIPDLRAPAALRAGQGLRVVAAPPSSGRMARRLQWLQQAAVRRSIIRWTCRRSSSPASRRSSGSCRRS